MSTRLRLGEILIDQGLITEAQLHDAINIQKQENGRLGEILLKMGMVKEETLAAALGAQLLIPYASRSSGLLKPQSEQGLDKLVSQDFAQKFLALPLAKNMGSLTCAVFDPLDLIMLDNLKVITGCEINLVIATKSDLIKAIQEFYSGGKVNDGMGSLLDRAVENTYDRSQPGSMPTITKETSTDAELSLDKLIAKAEEAPVIKLVDLIIRQAIDEKASDIHIETTRSYCDCITKVS